VGAGARGTAAPDPRGLASFQPHSQADLAPSGAITRIRANIEALQVLRAIQAEQRGAAPDEQQALARWSGWGAVPEAFDDRHEELAWARGELHSLLSDDEYAAAARSTINAHYTGAAIVQAIWAAVANLGFTSGQVLEPGCGSGNFIGFAPPAAAMTGVELEPVTAAIAAALYPRADIWPLSFTDVRAPAGTFDLAIGNVPFADVVPHDPRHNPHKHALHNYFIVKALHLTRPGGLVAVLTSRYTMDARNPAARREIAGLADLVGAVRLPSGAHQKTAGTTVVTDLLILRRREPGRSPDPVAWELARTTEVDGSQVEINEYFLDHPGHVLGVTTAVHGAYRAGDLAVKASGDTIALLGEALHTITTEAATRNLSWAPATPEPPAPAPAPTIRRSAELDGFLTGHADGTFTKVVDGVEAPHKVPGTQAAELRALLDLRDIARALLDVEATSTDTTAEMAELRRQLGLRYDYYASRWGPLNRFKSRPTGRVDKRTGEPRLARIQPPQGGFRDDPYAPLVYALEEFEPVGQRAAKAAIFSRRVVEPRHHRLGADTPADALAICMDTYGEVRLGEIARLLGTDGDTARAQLGTLVYEMPPAAAGDTGDLLAHAAADISALSGFSVTAGDLTGEPRPVVPRAGEAPPGTLVLAAEYLSGNVRRKLVIAQAAAADDARFDANVAALREVIPEDKTPGEIIARFGAAWIDASYVQQFLRELLQDDQIKVEHPGGQIWAVRGGRHSVLSASTWGTDRYPAPQLAATVLEQRTIEVRDRVDEDTYVLNPDATLAAQEKAAELCERFSEWVWEDPARAATLARVYNDKFNSEVLRSYDNVELSLPGLSLAFKPRPHQIAAVARMIHEPGVLLAHATGAGKTTEMIMGVTELKRLGLVRKPAIVIPNHMIDDFTRAWLQTYPRAKVLVVSKDDLRADRRRLFVARCATGDWDGIIMSRSAFERTPLGAANMRAYMDRELGQLREWIEKSKQGEGLTVKRLEKALARAEERLKAKLDSVKDDGITFEATGIDYFCYDEAHDLKNLHTPSNISDAAIDGSMRASDADMKFDYLRRREGRRINTLATATPIANAVTEAFVMQRFVRPDLLEAAGVDVFDSWAGTFGKVVSQVELAPEGGSSFRLKSRFASFVNAPELLRMWAVFADVKTTEDLNLPVPAIAPRPGDRERMPETVAVDPSDPLIEYVADLGVRADRCRSGMVRPDEDNMLKISGDGRRAALDLRLVGLHQEPGGKIEVAAARIAEIWRAHRDDEYRAPDGTPYPTRGSLQIVFCDLGTPSDDWNVYDELRDQLTARGMPREAIRFVHDARNDAETARLFAACRSGRIAVLVGSTQKMGVGTNVQDRAVALHHLDAPWRPADVEQREGRIVRQGNLNAEVQIIRYVTARSFDGYMWQTLHRKKLFIDQVMHGRLGGEREISDVGDVALNYAEVKAIATDNPLLMEQAEADAELTRLRRAERAYHRNRDSLAWTVKQESRKIEDLAKLAADVEAAIPHRCDTRGDKFVMVVEGRRHTKRPDAGTHLITVMQREMAQVPPSSRPLKMNLGELGGFPLTGEFINALGTVTATMNFDGAPGTDVRLTATDLTDAGPGGVIARLENRLTRLETTKSQALEAVERARREIDHAQDGLGKPFTQADQLTAAKQRSDRIKKELAEKAKEANAAHASAGEGEPATSADSSAAPDGATQPADPAAGAQPAGAPVQFGPGPAPGASSSEPAGATQPPGAARQLASPAAALPPAAPADPGPPAAAPAGTPSTAVAGSGARPAEAPGDSVAEHGAPPAGQPGAAVAAAGVTVPRPPAWLAAHPLASELETIRQAALADTVLAATARNNSPGDLAVTFGGWLDKTVAHAVNDAGPGQQDQAVRLAKAFFDDPVFAADLAQTLTAQVLAAHRPGEAFSGVPGEELAATTIDLATRYWCGKLERERRARHGCADPGTACQECTLLPAGDEDRVKRAAEIDAHLSRVGVPRDHRAVTADVQGGWYAVECSGEPWSHRWRLLMPDQDGQAFPVVTGDRVTQTIRPASPAAVARAYQHVLWPKADPGQTPAEDDPDQSPPPAGGQPPTPSLFTAQFPPGSPEWIDPGEYEIHWCRNYPTPEDPIASWSRETQAQLDAASTVAELQAAWAELQDVGAVDGAPGAEYRHALAHLYARHPEAIPPTMSRPRPAGQTARPPDATDPAQPPSGETVGADRAEEPPIAQPAGADNSADTDEAASSGRAIGSSAPAAPEGITIEHHSRGTLVHGTDKSDMQLRQFLRNRGFKWSSRLGAWYLGRQWTFSTRDRHVRGLLADLAAVGRSAHMDDQTPATDQATSAEPIPPGEPYETAKDADTDYRQLISLYWDVRDTSAGKRLLVYAMRDIRPDAASLKGAAAAAFDPAKQLGGSPDDVTARFTALAHAAQALTRNLTEDRYRAPQFMASLRLFTEAAEHLGARLAGTAQTPERWGQLFATPQVGPPATAPEPMVTAASPGAVPALEQATTGAGSADDQPQAASPPAPTAPGPSPANPRGFDAQLAEAAARHGLDIATVHGSGPARVVQVVDADREVLLYSVAGGATVGGLRVQEADVPAYLAAYRTHPHLPPPALLDLLEHGDTRLPSLSAARELARTCGLQVRIVRAAGTAYVTLCEPAAPAPPVLSYTPGAASAFHGPCEIPAAAIPGYLAAYRQSVTPAILTAIPDLHDWPRRVAQLTPHLVEGSGHHIPAITDNLRSAVRAHRERTGDEAQFLDRAELAAPPLTLTAEREAQIAEAITDNAAGYYRAGGDPARYLAEGHIGGSAREQDWIRNYLTAHPHVIQRAPVPLSAQQERRRSAAAGEAAEADRISRAAYAAFTAGRPSEALSLLDDAELADPTRADLWERRRAHVRQASAAGPGTRPAPGQLSTEPEAGQ